MDATTGVRMADDTTAEVNTIVDGGVYIVQVSNALTGYKVTKRVVKE